MNQPNTKYTIKIDCIGHLEWRLCPSFPNYEVSEYGHVRRAKVGPRGHFYPKLLKPRINKGYKQYGLMRDGKDYKVCAHRLVIEAFLGMKPFAGAQVCHQDGSRDNDHYSNLRWDSPLGNQSDRTIHGTDLRGEDSPAAKLTEEQVIEIRQRAALGELQREIAKDYSVDPSTISHIKNRVYWKHVD